MSFGNHLSEPSLTNRQRSRSASSLLPVTAPPQQACSGRPSSATIFGALLIFALTLCGISSLLGSSVRGAALDHQGATAELPRESITARKLEEMTRAAEPAPQQQQAEPAAKPASVMAKPVAASAAAMAPTADDPKCRDTHARCLDWANAGECGKNEAYMTRSCPRACGRCAKGGPPAEVASVATGLVDTNKDCALWAKQGECEKNPTYMAKACARSCVRTQATVNHDES